ncbi:uncharacterized protein SAPINGB_P000440 [Magnusiomyces paraingens]|uniref:Uncharacterized protein n=1 Tax=Magnusiomyces paraingens TaxID=2606893 RepID=A0A5E8B0F6_9ASCO|nr:uncharacterized protein SAPINGB_P000440 [Saprochaete ingens]VVT44509.1 unnamed protein product [Saprochaete ingens]
MCGRFVFAIPLSELSGVLRASGFEIDSIDSSSTKSPTSYNFAPYQRVPVYRIILKFGLDLSINTEHEVSYMTWSLDPGFKSSGNANSHHFATFNARIEKVEDPRGFWHRFLENPQELEYPKNRCIVLAQGYYEWQAKQLFETKKSTVKIPYYIRPKVVEEKSESADAKTEGKIKTEKVKKESEEVKEEHEEVKKESEEVKKESEEVKKESEEIKKESEEVKKQLGDVKEAKLEEPEPEKKHPVKPLLFFAGICYQNTVSIITRPVSSPLEWLHDREPVMLTVKDAKEWLKGNNDVLHNPTPPLEAYRVGRAVGKVSESGQDLCRKLTKEEIEQSDEENRISAMPKRRHKEEHSPGEKKPKLSNFIKPKSK